WLQWVGGLRRCHDGFCLLHFDFSSLAGDIVDRRSYRLAHSSLVNTDSIYVAQNFPRRCRGPLMLTSRSINFRSWRQRFSQRVSSKPKAARQNSFRNGGEVPMSRYFKGPFWLILPIFLLAVFTSKSFAPVAMAGVVPGQTPGSLQIISK